jgi:translation initiation factor IF-3
MPKAEALAIAERDGLDLVMMSASNGIAVCKILDYGKYKFDAIKKEKELKKNQKVTEIKEVQLSMTIDTHDLQVKAKHAKRFLEEGNKVKVTIKMRGRQQARPEAGIAVMATFVDMLEGLAMIEKNAEILGRNIIMILAPNKK